MRAQEAIFSGSSGVSATPANFTLNGGRYSLDVHATTWGTVTLNKLAQNGSSLIAMGPTFSADGSQVLDLPPGTYQLTLTGVTTLVYCISRVPLEA